LILDEIISIKKIGVEPTIDIEVDGPDHLFYVNGILTHNSAAGDTADITEENIQGGISKIQAADNVIGFIPNAQAREMGIMRAKFLKTRDSGGVGSYVDFKVDWSTLTFEPWNTEEGGAVNFASHVQSNMPTSTGGMQKTNKGKSKPNGSDLKRPSTPGAEAKSDDESDGQPKKARGIIKGLGAKKKSLNKSVKLV